MTVHTGFFSTGVGTCTPDLPSRDIPDILNVKKFTQTLIFSLKFYRRVRDYNQPKCLTKQRK